MYVLRLCEADYNGGKILSESTHNTFDAAVAAIPNNLTARFDSRSLGDIKNTLDSVGAWSICGIGNLSYVIHVKH